MTSHPDKDLSVCYHPSNGAEAEDSFCIKEDRQDAARKKNLPSIKNTNVNGQAAEFSAKCITEAMQENKPLQIDKKRRKEGLKKY